MLNGHRFACVLAARAGSGRLKNKNLRKCAGKPLWQYTKEAVENAGIFDGAVITTDAIKPSDEWGGWIWTGRPDDLAGDDAHISDVMQWLVKKDGFPEADYTCLVSPTNPLRTGKHIREAAKLMLAKKADAVVAVAPCHHVSRNLLVKANNALHLYYPMTCNLLTHGLSKDSHLTGAIVIAKTELWARKAQIYNDPNIKTVGYVMPKWDIDVDTKDDLFMAEAMIKCLRNRRMSLKSSIKSAIQARRSKNSPE